LEQADLKSNLEIVRERISRACRRVGRSPEEVTLIAVTKTVDPATIETAFKLGVRHFGENRVQEAEKKIKALSYLQPPPFWHIIGHLQSNKVNLALSLFKVFHSVDSVKLAEAIAQRARKGIPVIPVYLQVNVAAEATKGGFSLGEIQSAFESISLLRGISIRGLMTIAPLADDPEKIRPVFRKLRELRDTFYLRHLSMGMTDDFEIAIEEGSTMVRIGRAIFGERT
jgi:PLP dependent protein